jgi:hypothetical protein
VPQIDLIDAAGDKRLQLLGFERVALQPNEPKRVSHGSRSAPAWLVGVAQEALIRARRWTCRRPPGSPQPEETGCRGGGDFTGDHRLGKNTAWHPVLSLSTGK